MTVTREQAQMLTTLAIACRPYRAPTWDAPGVMAAIGQLKEWSLSEVALRVIVAAADREAKTPAVIASPGMQIPQTKPAMWQPDAGSLREFCGVCGKKQPACERARFADDDHVFTPDTRADTGLDAARAVAGLRDVKATEPPPVREKPTPGTEGTERVEALRAAVTAVGAAEEEA